MNNNVIFTTVMVLFTACVYVLQTDMIEGYFNNGPRNSNRRSNARITYNYNRINQNQVQNQIPTQIPTQINMRMDMENNDQDNIENQFNMIEEYQESNINNNFVSNEYNTRSPQELPEQNVVETFIPRREDYQHNTENSISSITPSGFRNGARPLTGAGLLRGEVNINNRENFVNRQTRQQETRSNQLPSSIRHATPIVSHLKF
tara:strand:- start:7 stop:618 length:612 start_codon:yes stop_codon:yes gene_type:complete